MGKSNIKSEEFFRLYNAAQQRIYAYLLMMVHNHSDADDLLQETASVLWERYEDYDKGKSFAAWGVGIARNKALDFMKSKGNSRASFNSDFYDKISQIEGAEADNVNERSNALRNCIGKLSVQNQMIVHYRFEKGLTVKKMSQESGDSADKIYKRLSRIYSALRDCVSRTLARTETA